MTTETSAFLKQAIRHLDQMNVFMNDGSLRRFQHDIMQTGGFEILSPHGSETLRAQAVYVMPNTGALYWFGDDAGICVLVGSLRLGYPILAILDASEIHWVVANAECAKLIEYGHSFLASAQPPEKLVDEERPVDVLIGHQNFAHFVWNEFPALFHAVEHPVNIRLRIKFDTLHILERLAQDRQIATCHETNLTPLWQSQMTTFAGAIRCDAKAKAYIVNVLNERPPALQIPGQIVYITLRNKGRTLSDQPQFLTELIHSVLALSGTTHCVLDGFSVPDDFQRGIYRSMRQAFETRARDAQNITEIVRQNLNTEENARVHDITGMTLSDALSIIRHTSYYVSHAGTTQHKAGWLYPISGTLHGNHASITPGSLKWTTGMIAGAIPPLGLNPDNVTDLDIQDLPNKNARNCDYAFVDMHEAVRDIISHITPHLER